MSIGDMKECWNRPKEHRRILENAGKRKWRK
jgi:hypothetical protein